MFKWLKSNDRFIDVSTVFQVFFARNIKCPYDNLVQLRIFIKRRNGVWFYCSSVTHMFRNYLNLPEILTQVLEQICYLANTNPYQIDTIGNFHLR